jgi:hypothetical protein
MRETYALLHQTWAGRKRQRRLSLEPMQFELRVPDQNSRWRTWEITARTSSRFTSRRLALQTTNISYTAYRKRNGSMRRINPCGLETSLPSHRKYQRRILPVVLITETERQRLWRARGIILTKIWLVEVFEQIDWYGVGTKEP